MTAIGRHFSARNLVIGSALLFLVVFVLFPLVLLVFRSFLGYGRGDQPPELPRRLRQGPQLGCRGDDALVCGLTMFFSMIFATGLAWLVVRSNLPWRRQFRSLFFIPYVIPPYVGAIAWILLITPGVGYINKMLIEYFGADVPGPFDIYTDPGPRMGHDPVLLPAGLSECGKRPRADGQHPGGGRPHQRRPSLRVSSGTSRCPWYPPASSPGGFWSLPPPPPPSGFPP